MCSTCAFVFMLVVTTAMSYPEWTSLRVKWSPTPGYGNGFTNIPIKKIDLDNDLWRPSVDVGLNLTDYNMCAYCWKNDPGVCPVYLNQGDLIVGVQIGFKVEITDPNFVERTYVRNMIRNSVSINMYSILFFDPDKGVGTIGEGLYLINWNENNAPIGATRIPTELADLKSKGFEKHRCHNSMGTHYFLNMSPDKSCTSLAPIYPILNNDKPVGFGILNLLKEPNPPISMKTYTNIWNEFNNDDSYPWYPWKRAPECIVSRLPELVQKTQFYFTAAPWTMVCTP